MGNADRSVRWQSMLLHDTTSSVGSVMSADTADNAGATQQAVPIAWTPWSLPARGTLPYRRARQSCATFHNET